MIGKGKDKKLALEFIKCFYPIGSYAYRGEFYYKAHKRSVFEIHCESFDNVRPEYDDFTFYVRDAGKHSTMFHVKDMDRKGIEWFFEWNKNLTKDELVEKYGERNKNFGY